MTLIMALIAWTELTMVLSDCWPSKVSNHFPFSGENQYSKVRVIDRVKSTRKMTFTFQEMIAFFFSMCDLGFG